MKKTTKGTALLAACVTTMAVTGCAGSGGAASTSSTLDIATMTLPQSLDPADATGSALPYFQAVYDTLVKREPDGSFSPMLATRWEYNDDRTELKLTLRDGVRFDDGTPFDAAAVKKNMERFAKGTGASAKTLQDVEKIKVTDATHVTLHLARPDPALVYHLSDAAGLMANPAAFGRPGDSLKTRPDGTGPYDLDSKRTAIGTKWVYKRAPGYWGTRLPYNEITFSYFDNETAIVNGIKTGQLNTALLQSADQQTRIEPDPKVKTVKQEFDFEGLLLFDRDGKIAPALKDARVRQALNHAIDRPTMLDKLRQGRGTITSQVFGPRTAAFDERLDGYYRHDPAKARDLLKQAGYADGFTLRLPRVTAIVPDALASSLQTDLNAIGVKVVWDVIDPSQIKKIYTERAYPAMVMNIGQSPEDWVTIGGLVLPGAGNMFGTTDGTVRELLPRIQEAPPGKAQPDLRALNEHLVRQAWFVPFYRMSYLHVSDGTVRITPQAGMAVPSVYNYAPAK